MNIGLTTTKWMILRLGKINKVYGKVRFNTRKIINIRLKITNLITFNS